MKVLLKVYYESWLIDQLIFSVKIVRIKYKSSDAQ